MPQISINKSARFDYTIGETFSAGLVLDGHEVKSVKMGHVDLSGSRAILKHNEVFVVGLKIPSFQPANMPADYDASRTRKLLLKKEEIKYLTGKFHEGLTLVPLSVYTNRGIVKLDLGLGKFKKKADKREAIRARETEREIRRAAS